MHRVSLHGIVRTIAGLLIASCAADQVSAERTAMSFDEVQAEAMRLAEASGDPAHVLLVFDIDNTLLAMEQDLGSDQWFNWQKTLSKHDPWRVGDFPELLRVQGLLFAIGSMRATEPVRQPQIVKQLQQAGFKTLLLTSRGYEFRDATRRELLANGYDFCESSLSPSEGFGGPYAPYRVGSVEQSGISLEEAHQWLASSDSPGQIRKPRKVSFTEGVYMVAGQHKGAMLRMLLHKSDNAGKFEHIVFVDDHATHTDAVRTAFASQPEDVVTFRYAREDANVRRFEANKNCEHQCAAEALAKIQRSWQTSNVSRANQPYSPPVQTVPVLPVGH